MGYRFVDWFVDRFTDSCYKTLLRQKEMEGEEEMSKRNKLSIAVEADTNKLQLKLRTIAKHAEALADELDAIDNAWQCDCGSFNYSDLCNGNTIVERICDECNERYAYPNEEE